MKQQIQRVLAAALIFTITAAQARAEDQLTDCVIYVHNANTNACAGAAGDAQLASHVKNNTWFKDVDWAGNAVAARCIERARESMAWCGGGFAYSVYRVKSHNVIGAGVNATGGGKTYLSDGVSRWTRFHD